MSSALSHSSSRSIATRVMYGVALVALLAFGVAAAASYLRSSQALLTGARATMEGLASLEAQRISGELGRAPDRAVRNTKTYQLWSDLYDATCGETASLLRALQEAGFVKSRRS